MPALRPKWSLPHADPGAARTDAPTSATEADTAPARGRIIPQHPELTVRDLLDGQRWETATTAPMKATPASVISSVSRDGCRLCASGRMSPVAR